MSQRKAKSSPVRAEVQRAGSGFRIPGLAIQDEDGRDIQSPTAFDYRRAILQLLEATGASVQTIAVDGHLCAFVSANPDEVPDSQCDAYYSHLADALQVFIDSIQAARATLGNVNAQGGDG